MSAVQLVFPVLVQVILTFVLLIMMGQARTAAVTSGKVQIRDIALGEQAWPEQPTKIANAYRNQFELPVLFYVLVALLIVTRTAGYLDLALAWAFVASRLVHAYIHVTTNRVIHRFRAFAAGVAVLAVMWLVFMVRIIASGAS